MKKKYICLLTLVGLFLFASMGMGLFAPVSQFREFGSVEELDQWCRKHTTILAVSGHPFTEVTPQNDCDDYAERLQVLALNDGYLMSVQLTEGTAHMGNLAMIGNDIYFIEPNPGKYEVIWLCHRD